VTALASTFSLIDLLGGVFGAPCSIIDFAADSNAGRSAPSWARAGIATVQRHQPGGALLTLGAFALLGDIRTPFTPAPPFIPACQQGRCGREHITRECAYRAGGDDVHSPVAPRIAPLILERLNPQSCG
jgi:hypothetical protein